jgi:hypothetical protein
VTAGVRPALSLVPVDEDQVPRLRRFRKARPEVVIDTSFGVWQARIPEKTGETVITRHLLRHLLDRLDEMTGDTG